MKNALLRLWNSPTFTTWANLSTKSLRFLLVTPLLVTKFDTTEIAAWYLFTSLTFFGSIIHARVTLTFNRMIAFAMAGAQDLSAIGSTVKPRGAGEPHWSTVKRAYSTVGFLTLITASLSAISGLLLGYFSLNGLLRDYHQPSQIWLALSIMVGGECLMMCFSQYMVTIQGMGLVALSNRWSCLFALLSIITGSVALSLGANIVILALAMQAIGILSTVRMKLLVSYVHGGALAKSRSVRYDKEVFRWAWPAFWRGLFSTVANRGVIQIGAVVFARYASAEAVAAYLFSFNILRTISSFAEAPLQSSGPQLSRTLAIGNIASLRRSFFKKARQAQLLFVSSTAAFGILIPIGLDYIGSNTRFLDPVNWTVLSFAFMLQRYLFVGLRLPALGNKVIYVKETTIAATLSMALMIPMVRLFGFHGLIIAMYAPLFVFLNTGPFRHSGEMFEMNSLQFMKKSCGWALVAYLTVQLVVIYLDVIQASICRI